MAFNPEDLEELSANTWKNVANGRSVNLLGENRTYGAEGEEPTNFTYPLDMMKERTDHLSIKIFQQVRSSDIFNIIEGGEVVKQDNKTVVTPITEIKSLRQFSDTFNDPSYQEKLETNTRFIFLPIPQQVSDALSVAYAEDTLNPLQAAGLSLTQQVANDPSVVLKAGDYLKALTDGGALTNVDSNTITAIKAAASGKALNVFGANVNTNSLISRASGQILQSNLELLFSGVTLRSFPFVYDFAPRDPREAEVVKGIIRTLKKAMVPKGGREALFINSPDVFQLEYKSGNENHPFLNSFKVCVLSDMAVNYTASGTYATYGDASPVHIQVQMTFKEINPIYAEDYDNLSEGGYKNVGY